MKNFFALIATLAVSNFAFAQSAGSGASDSTIQHPAANKGSDTAVPSRDGVYSNPSKDKASADLHKKQRQSRSRTGNGVIDQGAPGGMAQPEGKGQSNPTHPKTE